MYFLHVDRHSADALIVCPHCGATQAIDPDAPIIELISRVTADHDQCDPDARPTPSDMPLAEAESRGH